MKTVERLIGDLLLRHNCVIIPTFGGFVAKPVAAKIDYSKGTMLPPSKSLLFNRSLINNDGLLVNEYAQNNQVSFDDAARELLKIVDQWSAQLNKGQRVEIDRVGHLYFDEEKNICFEQDRFFNLLLESFGLSTVHFLSEEDVYIVEKRIEHTQPVTSPVHEEKVISIAPQFVEETQIEVQAEDNTQENVAPVIEHPMRKKRKAWRYVAAACLLPIAFYSVWIPTKTDVLDSGVISIKDFNPFYNSSKGTYEKKPVEAPTLPAREAQDLESEIDQLQSEESHYTFRFDDETYMKVKLPVDVSETTEVQEHSEVEPPIAVGSMNYIVGCFANKENAVNLVSRLKANNLDARIFDVKNGLHRVTAGSAISMESYYEIKAKADALGLSGWKLK